MHRVTLSAFVSGTKEVISSLLDLVFGDVRVRPKQINDELRSAFLGDDIVGEVELVIM